MLNKYQKEICIISAGVILISSGCARVAEVSKVVTGTSVKALNDARQSGKNQLFEYDYKTCYEKVLSALKEIKARVYLQSPARHVIVAMNFRGFNNTTEVGIFFSALGSNSTKVEISSLSQVVLEYAAEKIFSALKDTDRKLSVNSTKDAALEK